MLTGRSTSLLVALTRKQRTPVNYMVTKVKISPIDLDLKVP